MVLGEEQHQANVFRKWFKGAREEGATPKSCHCGVGKLSGRTPSLPALLQSEHPYFLPFYIMVFYR